MLLSAHKFKSLVSIKLFILILFRLEGAGGRAGSAKTVCSRLMKLSDI